mmetsp:Transcript_10636/g.26820  ORF Transcript_10636/g.26820 Transcript_10636/m.26820 type:complete len:357 (-) Transcript_10636:247-1317(-)
MCVRQHFLRQPLVQLLPPVRQKRRRRDDEGRPILGVRSQRGNGLHSFPQPHLVCDQAAPVAAQNELDPLTLVRHKLPGHASIRQRLGQSTHHGGRCIQRGCKCSSTARNGREWLHLEQHVFARAQVVRLRLGDAPEILLRVKCALRALRSHQRVEGRDAAGVLAVRLARFGCHVHHRGALAQLGPRAHTQRGGGLRRRRRLLLPSRRRWRLRLLLRRRRTRRRRLLLPSRPHRLLWLRRTRRLVPSRRWRLPHPVRRRSLLLWRHLRQQLPLLHARLCSLVLGSGHLQPFGVLKFRVLQGFDNDPLDGVELRGGQRRGGARDELGQLAARLTHVHLAEPLGAKHLLDDAVLVLVID